MPAPQAASTGPGLITCATRQLWSLNPSRRAYMKLSVNNQSKCPRAGHLNGRIWAFVASVGANSTPDIGESIFSGHLRRCQCCCWQHPRWFYGHSEVFPLTHQICGRAKHFCRRHRVPQDTHKQLRWKSGRENLQNGQENMGTEVFISSGYTGHGLGQ